MLKGGKSNNKIEGVGTPRGDAREMEGDQVGVEGLSEHFSGSVQFNKVLTLLGTGDMEGLVLIGDQGVGYG